MMTHEEWPLKHLLKISLIITTYNRPDALVPIFRSLAKQTSPDFEVIIADDGSTAETADLIKRSRGTLPFPLLHVWQEDQGFRAAQIRNKAAAIAQNDYLVFLDGDCIPPRHFIARHQHLAERNCFVSGNRILLSPGFTEKVLRQHLLLEHWFFPRWLLARLWGNCNRVLPLCYLPGQFWRIFRKPNWHGAKTCNLAVWKSDFFKVNGFDEDYQGWGYEDSDLVIRLFHAGIRRKEGRFAVPVFHLWHTENDRSLESSNLARLKNLENSKIIRAKIGVDHYL